MSHTPPFSAPYKAVAFALLLGVSVSPAPGQFGLGVNGGLSASKASGSSAIVVEQSAPLARGGSLNATVTGNTDLKGGVIAALDGTGRDTRNIHGSELHRWHVPDDIIDQVRNDLEPRGLILYSETEPVALPA